MATLLPLEGFAGHKAMQIVWVGHDVFFWRGAKALLSMPHFMLHPARQPAEYVDSHYLSTQGGIDLVVWDLGAASADELAKLTQAWAELVQVPVLVVCAYMDEAIFKALLALGVSGVLSKQIDGHYMVQSVKHIIAGQKVFSPEYRCFVQDPEEQLFQTLTVREREILTYLAKGVSNKVIAEALAVAPSTVKVHVQNILRKLQLTSRVQAAVYAVRQQG